MKPSEMIAMLKSNISEWNAWRARNPDSPLALRGADLYKADLRGAYLYKAYLYKAYLYKAHLSGADLDRADLRGADLRGAKGFKRVGQCPRGHEIFVARQPRGYRIKGGCRWWTHDEAVAHIEGGDYEDDLRAELMMYVRWAKELAELYGWDQPEGADDE